MHRSTIRLAAVLIAATLAIAACGDDSQDATAGADAVPPASDTTAPAGPPVSGEPVVIGFVNSEGGAFSVPEMRVGSEVAESVVNEQLGGIGGRPLEIVRCATDGSPESSIDCANQLVEEGVVAVHLGTDLGSDALVPVLDDAGIPIIGHVQLGIAGMFDENSFYLGSAALAYGAAALQFYSDLGAETITWFFPDVPTSRVFTDTVLTPAATAMGIEYKSVYYDAASPNFPVLAATAASETPDVSGALAATDGQCAELISALRGAGYQGHILAASCVGLYDAVGDDAIGVHTDSDHWNPGDIESAPAAKQEDLELYAAAMRAADEEDLVEGNAVISFADTINIARILSTIEGAIDGSTVAAALRATTDFDAFAGPTITCDHTVIAGNSACAASILFYEVQVDGSIRAVTEDFLDVAAALAPAG